MTWARHILRTLTGGNTIVDCPLCYHHRTSLMFTSVFCGLCASSGAVKAWKVQRYLRNIEQRARE